MKKSKKTYEAYVKESTTKTSAEDAEQEPKDRAQEDVEQEIGEQEQVDTEQAIMEMVQKTVKVFYTDEFGKPCVKISTDNIKTNCRLYSEEFADICEKMYWDEFKHPLKETTLTRIKKRLSCIAKFDAEKTAGKVEQHVRVAQSADCQTIWYSLNNPEHQAVEITPADWQIVDEPPCFRRFDHTAEQVAPDRGGDFNKIGEYFNLDKPHDRILLPVWIIAQFIPAIERPVLTVCGPQGSAKSTLCDLIRSLVDPSRLMLVTFPPTTNELAQNLYQNYLPVYDNISKISTAQSDTLCRAVTGGGIQKRELYTNDKTITWSFRRGVILNGINQVVNRPDLAERSLSVRVRRVEGGGFVPKQEIFKRFQADLPRILGGIFDILRKTLVLYSKGTPAVERYPRMAEFAKWGFFIAEALGIGGARFIEAYEKNIESHNLQVVTDNPVTTCLVRFIYDQPEKTWDGMMKNLLDELNKTRINLGYTKPPENWPPDPSRLSKEINNFIVNLEGLGIFYSTKRDSAGAQVHIELVEKIPTSATSASASGSPEEAEGDAAASDTEDYAVTPTEAGDETRTADGALAA